MDNLTFTLTMDLEQFHDFSLLCSGKIYPPNFIKEFIKSSDNKISEHLEKKYYNN